MFRWAGIFLLVSVPVALSYGWFWVVVAIPASIVLGFIVGEYRANSPSAEVKASLRELKKKQKQFDSAWRLPSLASTALDAKSGELTVELSDGGRFVADAIVLGLVFPGGRWLWVWEFDPEQWHLPGQVMRYRDPDRALRLREMLETLHSKGLLRTSRYGVFFSGVRSADWDNVIKTADFYEAECARVIEAAGLLRILERAGDKTFHISLLLKNPRWYEVGPLARLTIGGTDGLPNHHVGPPFTKTLGGS